MDRGRIAGDVVRSVCREKSRDGALMCARRTEQSGHALGAMAQQPQPNSSDGGKGTDLIMGTPVGPHRAGGAEHFQIEPPVMGLRQGFA